MHGWNARPTGHRTPGRYASLSVVSSNRSPTAGTLPGSATSLRPIPPESSSSTSVPVAVGVTEMTFAFCAGRAGEVSEAPASTRTSSVVATMGNLGQTNYAAAKAGMEGFTRALAREVASRAITVNAVAPGPTGTDLFYKGKSEQLLKTIAGFNPFNRIGEPDEVAEAIVYLSGNGARWVNGQVLPVNGGMA